MEFEFSRASLAMDRRSRSYVPTMDVKVRPAEERVCDFDDVVIPMTAEEAMFEAARCVQCPDPAPCMIACPTHNDIPLAMWFIEQGEFLEAAKLYRQSSTLPEICSRVCPHEQLCQGSCSQNKSNDPVLTGPLERFVMDYERQHAPVSIPVGEPSGHRVAVVGAGPAGLGCAEQLVQLGHAVTIFESKPDAGGLLTYGIPNFKLNKDVVFARVDDLKAAGVKFVFNTYVGRDRTIDDLLTEFDAVFVGIGTEIDAPMEAEGENLPGVYKATEYLIRANLPRELKPDELKDEPVVGKKVVVIGGGDTASDCLRTSLRMGAEEVTCVYRRTVKEMPGGAHDRTLAMEEGAKYHFLTQPLRFIADEDGKLARMECIKMELGEPDKKGRRRPVPIEGSNFFIECDTAVLALGYWPDPIIMNTTPNLQTDKWGLITADVATGATSRQNVFAGGDDVTGPSLVVTAMVAGRNAARSIHAYLQTLEKLETVKA